MIKFLPGAIIAIIGFVSSAFGQNGFSSNQALEKLTEGDFQEAKRIASGMIVSNPKNSTAFAIRGRILFGENQLEMAMADLEKAIQLDPHNGVFYAFLADCYKLRNSQEQYKKAWDTAIRLMSSPKLAIEHYALGIAYTIVENEEKAFSEYSRAIKLNPRFAIAYVKRGNMSLKKKNYDAALSDFTKAIEINPQYAEGYFNRGNLYYEAQKYDLAITEYSKVIKLNPKDTDAYFNRGVAYKKKKQYDMALADYTTVVNSTPDDASIYQYRGNLYVLLQKPDLALADYTKSIALKPGNAAAHIDRGNIYLNKKQYDLALADYKKVIEIAPKDAVAYNNIGAIHSNQQHFKEALDYFTKSVELDPKYLVAYLNRADVYEAIGNTKMADRDRKKYSDLGGTISASAGKARRAIFPQGSFNAESAKKALGRGLSKIVGKACTKRDGLIFAAAGAQVVLYPVTPYLEEWYKLRNKKEDKQNGVYMSQEANQYAIQTTADSEGRFVFEGLMPGKYFIHLVHQFNQRKIEQIYDGSDTHMEGIIRVHTNYYYDQYYIVERSQRLEKFVEIKQDGESKRITLSNGLIKGCVF